MRRTVKQPYLSKSWLIVTLISVAFVALEYGLKFEIEGSSDKAYSWLDLTLFLGAYLFVFCLQPLQAAIHRKLCRRAPRSDRRKASS